MKKSLSFILGLVTFWNCASKKSKKFYVVFQFGGNFDAQILKIYKIHWILRTKQTSVLFCQYLRNKRSDLHKILCGSQLLSCELKFQILCISVHKCACTSCKCARARYIANAHVFNSCARIYERIFMKF